MFIWGIVMIKAKLGLNAASSKDPKVANSNWKNTLSLCVLAALATFAQFRFEQGSSLIANSSSSSRPVLTSSVHDDTPIPASPYEDYQTLLSDSIKSW